jgi:[CysO sulfur-carrier protein]-S-L-cysteine hydrolase
MIKNIETITIPSKEFGSILSEFDANKPYEACGILTGIICEKVATVEKAISITNVKRTRSSFELDPQQLYNAWNNADKNGRDVIGIYHTHPSFLAIPSSWDRETMKNNNSVWLIVGIDGVKAYILDGDTRQVKLEII